MVNTGPWSAELTGDFGELDVLPAVNGMLLMISGNDIERLFTGASLDAPGLSLVAGVNGSDLDTDYVAGNFSIGTFGKSSCVGDMVTFRYSQTEPTLIGTFAGAITCGAPTAEAETTYDGTISGRFEK